MTFFHLCKFHTKPRANVGTLFFTDLCQNVHCKHGARCEGGHCICAFDCPDAYDPVCGSDGTTYRNDCEMRRGSCQKGINLATVFFGECDRTPSGSWEGKTSFFLFLSLVLFYRLSFYGFSLAFYSASCRLNGCFMRWKPRFVCVSLSPWFSD